MNFKANGHHGADELLIITVRCLENGKKKKKEERQKKKKTICVKFFHVCEKVKSMRYTFCSTLCGETAEGALNRIRKSEKKKKIMPKPSVNQRTHFDEIICAFFLRSNIIIDFASPERNGISRLKNKIIIMCMNIRCARALARRNSIFPKYSISNGNK